MKKFSIIELFKKYVMCLAFSVLLLVIVLLSEILRNLVLAVSSAMSSGIFILNLLSWYVLMSFVFLIIPLFLLASLLINPKLMEAFLATFGVTEELLDKKKKNEAKKEQLENV